MIGGCLRMVRFVVAPWDAGKQVVCGHDCMLPCRGCRILLLKYLHTKGRALNLYLASSSPRRRELLSQLAAVWGAGRYH